MIGDVPQGDAKSAARKGNCEDGPQLLLDASIAVAPLDVAAIRVALEKNDALNKAGGAVPMVATKDGAGRWAGVGEGGGDAAAEFAGWDDDSRGAGGFGRWAGFVGGDGTSS